MPEGADSSGLSLTRYEVVLQAEGPLDLPAWLGSTLRGAFGHAFRRTACPGELCPDEAGCPYHQVFETRLPENAPALRSFDEIPRPFVIAPLADRGAPQPDAHRLPFELTLVGRAQSLFPYFVVALREVARLGRGRRPVCLDEIALRAGAQGDRRTVFSRQDNLVRAHNGAITLTGFEGLEAPHRFGVRFLTPARLKHGGNWIRHPEFHVLVRRLLSRLSSLALFHCDRRLDLDFRGLIAQAERVALVEDRTHWRDLPRYSSRQDRHMVLGGIVGDAEYEGPVGALWPFLVFGQWTHVGKNATFGLGRYEIVASPKEAA